MNISCYNGFNFITSEILSAYGIKHLFSTIKDTERNLEHGVGFSTREGFCKEEILENYRKTAEFLNVPFENITKSTQIHEDNILIIENKHIGMGVSKETDIKNADGLMTDKPDVPLCIFSADCVPVLIADKNKKVVAAVHSGWRGTAKEIAGKAVNIMAEKYGVEKSDIVCAIGPAIGVCCFEVSKEVIDSIAHIKNSEKYYYKKENGKYQLDLNGLNKNILIKNGIKEENIDVSSLCTKCREDLFYSYRRQGEKAGRNAAFIVL